MVVGPLDGHGAQGRADRLCTPAGVAGRVSAPAGQAGGVLVTVVGVEPLGDETSRHCEDGGAHRRLGRLEVAQRLRRVGPQQPLDLTCRFGRQRLGDHRGLRFFCCAAGRQTRLAQGIVDLDEHLRQLPEAAILGEPRLRLRLGVGRDDACDRLAGLLARQRQDRTVPGVAWLGAMTPGLAAGAEAFGQRTGAHLADGGELTAKVCVLAFQRRNLFIGHDRVLVLTVHPLTDCRPIKPCPIPRNESPHFSDVHPRAACALSQPPQ